VGEVCQSEAVTSLTSLEGLELVRVRLKVLGGWTSQAGSFSHRDSLLVRVVMNGPGGEVEGWGECAALPEPSYTGEYTEAAVAASERFLVPTLLKAQPLSAPEVATTLQAVKGHKMAKAAFEAAVMDAELRARGLAAADYFVEQSQVSSSHATSVPAGVALSLPGDVPALLEEVSHFVEEGYRAVKLKISPFFGPAPASVAKAVREAWPGLVVCADANGAYGPLGPQEAAKALSALDELGLCCIEQPLGEDDLLGHARLAQCLRTPVCLDESLTSYGLVEAALELRACSVVNVKPGRLGGYLEAVRVHDLCARRGAPLRCGGMVETGVGRAFNVALASLPGFSLPGDLTATGRFFQPDVAGGLGLLAGGEIAVPGHPGSGVQVDPKVVSAQALWRRWWPAR
jgi:O-succinylbenzoate synthase